MQKDINVTPNSTVAYQRAAVEALDLQGRYSIDVIGLVNDEAVEALDLQGRYSPWTIKP